MEDVQRIRKIPKHLGPTARPVTYDCKANCYGTNPSSEWQVGWLMGSVLHDNGVITNAPVVSFTATWEVPALPVNPIAEVYLFTQLQSTNGFILQPCLCMYPGPDPQWWMQSVMYHGGNEISAKGEKIQVSSGQLITGKIQLYNGKWEVVMTSEAPRYESSCSLPASTIGQIMSGGFSGLTLEAYEITNQLTADQLPGTSCMWFDMGLRILGKPIELTWTPWLSDCLINNCFPWLNLGEGVTMLDSQTALMKFTGTQDHSPAAKERMAAQAKAK